MDEYIKKIDSEIERLKQTHYKKYVIQAHAFEYADNKFDFDKIDLQLLSRMIILYEFRDVPLDLFSSVEKAINDQYKTKSEVIISSKDNDIKRFIASDSTAYYQITFSGDEEKKDEYTELFQKCFDKGKQLRNQYIKNLSATLSNIRKIKNSSTNKNSELVAKSLQREKEKFLNSDTYNHYVEIQEYYRGLVKKETIFLKDVKQLIKNLNRIKNAIEKKLTLFSLHNIDFSLMQEIGGMQFIYDVLSKILEGQQENYSKLVEEKELLIEDEISHKLSKLFELFDLNYEEFNDELKLSLRKCNNIDELKEKLLKLNFDRTIQLTPEIVKILNDLKIKQIDTIAYIFNSKVASKVFIFANLDRIFKNFESICKNSDIIIKHKLPNSTLYDENILFLNHDELIRKQELLKKYRTKVYEGDFSYLYSDFSFDILDTIIENNLELDSFDNYYLSEEEIKDLIKRLHICNELDINIYSKNGNLNRSFLLGNNFYCDSEQLDQFILNNSYENKDIIDYIASNKRHHISEDIYSIKEYQSLEEYKSDNGLYYDFGSVIISRNKVMRNLTLFLEDNNLNEDTILQSIIYNSNLNDEEVVRIKKVVFDAKKIKK